MDREKMQVSALTDFDGVGREVVSDGVLSGERARLTSRVRRQEAHFYDLEQLFGTIYTSDGQFVEKLNCGQALDSTSWPAYTKENAPIKPLNLLKVLGMRTWGFTSMSTPFAV